jgi:uncharacterized membrane protein
MSIKSLFVFENLKLKKIVIFSLILSLLGIADTIYLTIAHYTQSVILACPTTSFINCAKVTTSSYSEIFGIPVSLIGLIFFLGLFVVQLPIFWTNRFLWIKTPRIIFVSIGLASAFWFIYVELHKLHAICLYCTGVHILTFLSFITIIFTSEHFVKTAK